MKGKITFVTLVSGNRYVRFLVPHIYSILTHHPSAHLLVYYNDIDQAFIEPLSVVFPDINFTNLEIIKTKDTIKRISGKFNYIVHACQNNPLNTRMAFIDVDTVIVKPVDKFFGDDFDIMFTWKDELFPLNTGVLLFNNNKVSKSIFEYINYRITQVMGNPEEFKIANDTFGAADQYILNEILQTRDYSQNILREVNGEKVVFKPIPCQILNETRSVPISDDTHIIHYKAGWHSILLDGLNFHKNRPKEQCWEMYQYWLKVNSEALHYVAKHFITSSSKSVKDEFIKHLPGYEERGMLNSELLAFCAACKSLKVDLIVESGRCRAQSTYTIANYFNDNDVNIISIEFTKDENAAFAEERLKNFKKLTLLYGDSIKFLKGNRIKGLRNAQNAAVLLDGPKGEVAINLAKELFAQYNNIRLIAIHDTRKETIQREILERDFESVFFTDDTDFVELFKGIDKDCESRGNMIKLSGRLYSENAWSPYRQGDQQIKSYGPTLVLILCPNRTLTSVVPGENSFRWYINRCVSGLKSFLAGFCSRTSSN